MDSDSQIPDIRTFQFDSAATGDLSSSVNLFRGDINLSQALLSMPGRVQGDGLDVSVSLLYQSNVTRDAATWNRDAPTGVAGLGWSLPTTFIQLDDGRATTPGARSYSYVSNGTPTPMAREPETPFLLSMDGSLSSQLQDGQPVPTAVRAAFVALGVNLSPNATVSATSSTTWTLEDGDNQQLFDLQLSGAELEAYDGGESYQLFNYAFWKVLYYPQYERWVVTSEKGQRTSFGGLGPETSQGYATSAGNSIEWAVQWTAWTGASEQTTGQSQYARAWHQASGSSLWGDSIQYGYNEWPRNSSGLIPVVEQLVGGSGGLPYTKAHYLTSVTDVFGRKAVFTYGDKLWSDATPESAREYADPHQATPGNDPNAYQDRYETFYLQGITVQDPAGAPLFGITLSYLPTANVTSFTGSLYGDTCKRFLTGVTQSNAQGDTLPGLVFDYYLDDTDPGSSPGALKSVTYPQGGVATYTYTQQSLDVCDRTFEVAPPSSDFTPSTPRVFFGPDYAVVCWYNSGKGMLSLQAFTWLGRWEPWSLTTDTVLFNDANGLTLDSLNAVTGQDFFALSFEHGTNVDVYAFQKDVARPGQWVPATVNGTTTAPNVPTRSYPQTSGTVTLQGGDTFLLAASMDTTNQVYSYDRLTWRWTTGAWTLETATLPNFTWVTANNEYHLFLDTQGNVSLWYLDPTLQWVGPSTATLQGFTYAGDTSIALVPSETFVVASNLLQNGQQSIQYQLTFLQWDESYSLPASPASFTFQDAQEPSFSNPTTWVPQVVNDSFVAVAANLLRFNGQTWLTNSNLTPSLTYGLQQRYAYGQDYAIQVLVPGGGVGTPTAQVLSFDPDADSSSWTRAAATPAQALPVPSMYQGTANWPAAGGEDYLTIGQYLWFRGTATDWDGVVAQSPADLQAAVNQALNAQSTYQLNAESAVDEAPSFQAYYVYDTSDASQDLAAAVVLKNGGVSGQPETLASQRIFAGTSTLSGQAPGGPLAFAAYPSSDQDFDHASKVLLHRYAGDSTEDPLVHYAVTGLSITDGFGLTRPTAYFPDPSMAACDPTGLVVKYYEVTTYPGTDDADPDAPPYGTTVTRYLNGLEDVTGADYYNMLDGQLSEETVYDSSGTLLSQDQRTWQVYVTRASDPVDSAAAPLNLYGGFVCQTSQSHMEDGVTNTQATSYLPAGFTAPYSGQPVSIQQDNTGGGGVAETFTTLNTYAYEVNDSALALHALTLPAQKSTTWTSGGDAAVPVKATATTYTGCPSVAGADVLVPGVEGSFSWLDGSALAFPFSSYLEGDTPAGWQLTTRTTARDVSGQVTETLDGCGVAQSTLYSADRSLPVVRVTNASTLGGAWAYLGFESYEATAGWTVQGATVVTGDAHTGSNSLSLPAGGGASLSTQVTPPNEDQTYLLGYWYKTPAGFTPATGAGFTVTPSVDGTASTPLTSAFQDTGGAWAYATLAIPLTAGQSSLSLAISAANASSSAVLVDDVLVVPMVSKVVARAYDPSFRLVLSTLDSAGRALRTIYDDFQRITGTVGPQERVKQLAQHFASREGSASGAFDPASPNAALTVQPASGGTLETFTTGSEWQTRWLASNLSSSWGTSGGALNHTASTSDTLAWQGDTGDTCALFFEVQPPATLSGALGVTFGGGYQLAYDPSSGYSFQDPTGNTVQSPLASPPSMMRQWLVVFGDGVVLCFGDGQLLFSTPLALDDLGTVSIFTGPNALSIRNLSMVSDVRVTLTHQDATGQDRQAHRLWGDDARVSAVICDAIGRTVAITRMAPASFGAGASQPLLAYRSTFVDVAGFLASMSDTWELTGDVADYYRGQSDGPVPRSDDGGYPYFGYRFEASSRQRRLEQGAPGEAYAIHDLSSTQPADRQTTQFLYGPNSGSSFSNLPDGDYRTDTVILPTKASTTTLRDTLGRKVASMTEDASDAVVSQGQADASFTSGSQGADATLSKRQPNAFTTSPQSNPAGYVESEDRNPLGLMVQSTDPDTGTSLFQSDPCGRRRFVQPQLDAGETWFAYYKYDALGRVLEEGIVNQAWDPAQLAIYAAQPDWPDSSVSRTVSRTHSYDGDGTDADSIGKEVQVVTVSGTPTVTVTETYGYDGDGNLDEVAMQVSSSSGSSSGAIGYTYDNLQEVTQVTYPDGATLPSMDYGYDDQGQVISISDLATYTYTVDGELETEVRNSGQLTGTYQYASPGWLLQHSVLVDGGQTPTFQLTYEYNADGTVQSRTKQDTKVTYAYDAQLRLQSATVADSQPGNEAITQYDANGNIWGLTQDGTTYAFTCAAGSNQLATMSVGGGAASSFTYDADGSLLESPDLSFQYDPCLRLTTGLKTKAATPVQVQLAYNAKGGRALRLASTDSAPLVYFRGLSQKPLATYDGSALTQYVHGPAGLVASVGEAVSFPIQDTAHTVWAVVDDGNATVAQYDYLPFGLQLSATGSQPDAVPFRFMGQELDEVTGLYDFGARLYHPLLRRFCSPDSARQFASPYLFVGNNPLSMVDPSGNVSTWGRAGIGVGMFALATAGILLSVFSFGISDIVTGFLETLGFGAEAGAGAGSAGVGGGTLTTGVNVADETDALLQQGGMQVAKTVAQQAGKQTLKVAVDKFAGQIVSNTMFGVGESGFQYDVSAGPNANWSGKGFRQSLVSGAISGALYGVGSGLMGLEAVAEAIKGVSSFAARTAIRIGANVLMGVATGEGAQVVTNAAYGQSLRTGWKAEVTAGAIGGLFFGIGSVLHDDPVLQPFRNKFKPGTTGAASALDNAKADASAPVNNHVQGQSSGYGTVPDAPSGE